MLKFTSIVGYTSCGPTYIESFLTIFGQCINVLNYKFNYFAHTIHSVWFAEWKGKNGRERIAATS